MPISDYLAGLRRKIGTELVLMPGVAAVIKDQGRVLMQRRSDDGLWGLPAGSVDPGEPPAQSIVREVFEETGLIVRPVKLLGLFGGSHGFRHTYPSGDQVEYMTALFECVIVGGELQINDDESLELRFFSKEEMPKIKKPYPDHLFDPVHNGPTVFQWDESWLGDLVEP